MAKHKKCPTCEKDKFEFLVQERANGEVCCDSCWLDMMRLVQALMKKPGTTIEDVRAKRDRLLTASDWVEYPGPRKGMSAAKLKKWDKYRQALRDITKDCIDFDKVVFPKKPD